MSGEIRRDTYVKWAVGIVAAGLLAVAGALYDHSQVAYHSGAPLLLNGSQEQIGELKADVRVLASQIEGMREDLQEIKNSLRASQSSRSGP